MVKQTSGKVYQLNAVWSLNSSYGQLKQPKTGLCVGCLWLLEANVSFKLQLVQDASLIVFFFNLLIFGSIWVNDFRAANRRIINEMSPLIRKLAVNKVLKVPLQKMAPNAISRVLDSFNESIMFTLTTANFLPKLIVNLCKFTFLATVQSLQNLCWMMRKIRKVGLMCVLAAVTLTHPCMFTP